MFRKRESQLTERKTQITESSVGCPERRQRNGRSHPLIHKQGERKKKNKGPEKERPKPRIGKGGKYQKERDRDRNRESRMAEKNRDPNGLGEYKREVAQFGRA